jgi:hypothetical protein
MSPIQARAIVTLVVSLLGVAAVYFPQYMAPLAAVGGLLTGKEFLAQTPSK